MGFFSSSPWRLLLLLVCISLLFALGTSQQAATDPVQAAAVEAIFRKLKINMNWNTTSDPCTGGAVDPAVNFEDNLRNPLIKCECRSDTFCNVTQLKIVAMSASGPIPDELQNLTHLTNLNLAQNNLTGPLPSFIGKLTKMQYMSLGINGLSGAFPKEIGSLVNLISLGIGSNYFSGPLPSEFGNLTNLKQLYMDSSGISGEIPPSFAQLTGLKTIWASDNNFTGSLADFFGNFQDLQELRLQGNSFVGPIPSSFANLTNLVDLRIGDIISGSSSMDFIKNMKSLSSLVLRNAKISDVIPTNIADYTNLGLLDLSFNNFTGSIPPSLFNMSGLSTLFLGSNSLSGGLPLQKVGKLQTIDVSYNNLSGTLPTWVNDANLQLNLVVNNFTLSSSDNSIPSQLRLECLQNDFPCYRQSPNWYNFAINCGGKTIEASDGLTYEQDDKNITAASYYVTPDKRWAISNVGIFQGTSNPLYLESNLRQYSNTRDTELFQSSRRSPSSLRYYGLGLEVGSYNVTLHFVERTPSDTEKWQSLGRRIFDIYIQGKLVEKDFDIRKSAGGRFDYVIEKKYTTNVTASFLEIHLFWAGKGTCCIPTQGSYGPSISAISAIPNFTPTVSNQAPTSGSSSKSWIIGLVVSLAAFIILLVCAVYIWKRKKGRSVALDPELQGLDIKSEMFSYAEIKAATDNFNPLNKLGEGGFGSVFKGTLSDGREVAVKQLSATSHQGKQEFVAEIGIITAVQHRNLVKLYGCCFEGNSQLLVYEHLENKSLDQALFGNKKLNLDWPSRFNICLGTARGLAYLHEDSSVRIVHRDVKASNILLDSELNPKISDFGLAKLYDDKKTHISTRIAGTIGYLAPEYALMGHLTEKADIFSFGVLLLEIVSGRPNTDSSLSSEKMYLLQWAWKLHDNNAELELVDRTLDSYVEEEAIRVIRVALLCTQTSPSHRPPMTKAVSMLAGDAPLFEITSKPGYLTALHSTDIDSAMFALGTSSSTSVTQTEKVPLVGGSSTDITVADHSHSFKDGNSSLKHAFGQGR